MRTHSVIETCCLFVFTVLVASGVSVIADDPPAAEQKNESRKLDKDLPAEPAYKRALEMQKTALPGFDVMLQHGSGQHNWYTYTGEKAKMSFLRQDYRDAAMEWETAPIPDSVKDDPTFIFVGGLGWMDEPKKEGFVLMLNDKKLLNFDVAVTAHEWQNEKGDVKLFYLPTWRSPAGQTGPDSGGFFFLTVPKTSLTPGKPGLITVQTLAEGTRRWFALKPVKDANKIEIPKPKR